MGVSKASVYLEERFRFAVYSFYFHNEPVRGTKTTHQEIWAGIEHN